MSGLTLQRQSFLLIATISFACSAPVAARQDKQLRALPLDRYAVEWRRTQPDFVVYKPRAEFDQGENQHFLVVTTPRGRLLAVWTQATHENHADQHVVCAHSTDNGATWTQPLRLDGAGPGDRPGTGLASWAFPIVAHKTGRVWVFYNKNVGIQDTREDTTGVLRGRFSDDDGDHWSTTVDLTIAPCALSHPDPKVPQSWIVWQSPLTLADGAAIVGFTHWGSRGKFGRIGLFEMDSEVRFIRFENINSAKDCAQLRLTFWPPGDHGLRVARRDKPSVSVAQEPSLAALPTGELFCTMRTLNGYIAWSQSADGGRNWQAPAPLRYSDAGGMIENPIAPCPIYAVGPGRYVLLYFNNPGAANGGKGPADFRKNRQPLFIARGWFQPGARQPIAFEPGKRFLTTDGVVLGPSRRTEVGTYTSCVPVLGRPVLWYPDRKHFLLGRYLEVD